MEIVQAILDRAISDPSFLRRFREAPVEALEEEGFDLSGVNPGDLQALRGIAGRSWQGLAEVLQQRISRVAITGSSPGATGAV